MDKLVLDRVTALVYDLATVIGIARDRVGFDARPQNWNGPRWTIEISHTSEIQIEINPKNKEQLNYSIGTTTRYRGEVLETWGAASDFNFGMGRKLETVAAKIKADLIPPHQVKVYDEMKRIDAKHATQDLNQATMDKMSEIVGIRSRDAKSNDYFYFGPGTSAGNTCHIMHGGLVKLTLGDLTTDQAAKILEVLGLSKVPSAS